MAQGLSKGVVAKLRTDEDPGPITLQVLDLQSTNGKYRCQLSDGSERIKAVLATQLGQLASNGQLKNGSVVGLKSYVVNVVDSGHCMMVTDLEVLGDAKVESDAKVEECEAAVTLVTPNAKKPATDRAMKENHRPVGANQGTPGPTPSPSEAPQVKFAKTPANPTPPQQTPPTSSRTSFHKIAALHPYSYEPWTIKAKLARKYPVRTIKTKNGESKLMTVELIDDQGSQVQGTFWRNQAERYWEELQEGRVYVVSKFSVKPANKKYSSVKNDYELDFSDRTEVSEAADQDTSAMTATVEIVPIDQLPKFINRKAPVDVLGVVVSVGQLGTVKRKNDNTELQRRDVTLADQSGKSVVLTLWGNNAAGFEGDEGNIMLCTSCKATDYNGCSLSTLTKSTATLEPTSEAAQQLRDWYQSEGKAASFSAVGGDAVKREGGASGSSRRDQVDFIKGLQVSDLPAPDAKATYHNIFATVAYVNPDQSMYYLAHPETGRKVVERDGRYYSEFDDKYCDKGENRYVMSLKALDCSGQEYLNLFNEQAEQVLGMNADTLAELKSSSEGQYKSKVQSAQWGEWAMTVVSKSREYNGERRMRYTAISCRPVNFTSDSQRLLDIINKY